MIQYFYPYWEWEDYKNGFFDIGTITDEKLNKSIKLLSDQEYFLDVMHQMQIDWPKCFKQNLSNTGINRRAWLGQAACCYEFNNEFNVTIEAWYKLNEFNKLEANKTANKIIALFELENGKNFNKYECSGRCERTIDMDF